MIPKIEMLKDLLKTDTEPYLIKFPSENKLTSANREASIAPGKICIESSPDRDVGWCIWSRKTIG